MAQNSAWYTGADAVISWYKSMCEDDTPYFSVWCGKQLLFSYCGSSMARGVEILDLNLRVGEESGSSVVMTIKLHDELSNGKINEKTPYCGSINFRCVGIDQDSAAQYAIAGVGYSHVKTLEARLAALEGDPAEEKGFMGVLNGLVNNPQYAPIIGQLAVGVINKILPGIFGQPAAPVPSPTMAGVDSVKDLEWAMDQLAKVDPQIEQDLVRLAIISEKNPTLFQTLITSLRSM